MGTSKYDLASRLGPLLRTEEARQETRGDGGVPDGRNARRRCGLGRTSQIFPETEPTFSDGVTRSETQAYLGLNLAFCLELRCHSSKFRQRIPTAKKEINRLLGFSKSQKRVLRFASQKPLRAHRTLDTQLRSCRSSAAHT